MCLYINFTAILIDITENNIRPLLLSAVPSPPAKFIKTLNVTIADISNALTGNGVEVNLEKTISKYLKVVASYYLDKALTFFSVLGVRIPIALSNQQKNCATRALYDQIYNYTNGIGDHAEFIDLFQNIESAVAILKQVMNCMWLSI